MSFQLPDVDLESEVARAAHQRAVAVRFPHRVILIWRGGSCRAYSIETDRLWWTVPALEGYASDHSKILTVRAT